MSNDLLSVPHWYAVYTCSRHEKTVAVELVRKGVTCFLPLREARRRWKDRVAFVQLPLFSGYVFVDIPLTDKLKVLKTPGVVNILSINGRPEPIPSEQILAIMTFLEEKIQCDPYPYLQQGQRVEVVRGPLKGIKGILVKKKSKYKLVLSVDLIQHSVALEVEYDDVEPIHSKVR